MSCPLDVIDIIGKKWTFSLLEEINASKLGFNSIAKKMRISPKVLAGRLKELEEQGILIKEISTNRTKYVITEKGISLHAILHNLKMWHSTYSNSRCSETLCSNCTERITRIKKNDQRIKK